MAETKAKPVTKTERKKPVRTAPAQKDYPTKLAWLKAMTEHEEAEAAKANAAKVARLEKRLAAKREAYDKLGREINELVADIDELGGFDPEADEAAEPEADQPQG